MSVKLIRLISGEELIGEVSFVGNSEVKIEKPAIVIIQRAQTATDRMGIALVGWMPYTDAERGGVTFDKSHVLFVVDPEESLAKSYRERFTAAGLVVPQLQGASPNKSGLVIPNSFKA